MFLQEELDTESLLLFHQPREFQSTRVQKISINDLKWTDSIFQKHRNGNISKNPTCRIPCQWMATFSVSKLFLSSTMTVSFCRAWIVGPGVLPLIVITTFLKQSGDLYSYFTSHLYLLILASAIGTIFAKEKINTHKANKFKIFIPLNLEETAMSKKYAMAAFVTWKNSTGLLLFDANA